MPVVVMLGVLNHVLNEADRQEAVRVRNCEVLKIGPVVEQPVVEITSFVSAVLGARNNRVTKLRIA